MKIVNVMHGSYYALGAYAAASLTGAWLARGYPPMLSYLVLLAAALAVTLLVAPLIERGILRFMYARDEVVILLITYALAPLVDKLEGWRVPRWLGAAVVLLAVGGGLGWTGYRLSDSASQLLDALPAAAQKLRQAVRTKPSGGNPLDTVQKAASQLEQAAQENSARVTAPRGVQRVLIVRPGFNRPASVKTSARRSSIHDRYGAANT